MRSPATLLPQLLELVPTQRTPTPPRLCENFSQLSGDFPYFGAVPGEATRMKQGDRTVSPQEPALPVWRAFVVQFAQDRAGGRRRRPGTFSGRIEHLSSGRRARFESPDELVATLTQLLEELGKAAR